MKTQDEARKAFHSNPTKSTAAHYLMEALQAFSDSDLNDPNPVIRAIGETAFWLEYGQMRNFPPPQNH